MLAAIVMSHVQSVDEIGAGERLSKRAEGAPAKREQCNAWRVLDASTGRPLAGVRVEAWTED